MVDFWSSCCINCIHVLAEMDRLEQRFSDIPEVAFLGCHSAKFQNEKDLQLLRQAVIRYDVRHPVLNDRDFLFWGSMGTNCWPLVEEDQHFEVLVARAKVPSTIGVDLNLT